MMHNVVCSCEFRSSLWPWMSTWKWSLQVHNYNDAQCCVFLWIQIKLMATDEHLKVVHEEAVRFDSDLPQYKWVHALPFCSFTEVRGGFSPWSLLLCSTWISGLCLSVSQALGLLIFLSHTKWQTYRYTSTSQSRSDCSHTHAHTHTHTYTQTHAWTHRHAHTNTYM